MIQITKKQNCSGCHACVAVCPKGCISMQRDKEGFLYPIADKSSCINCGLCEKACQSINPIKSKAIPKAYAAYNKNEDVRMKSSSGGTFTLIAEYIINKGGAVFGAAFDEELNVHHVCVERKEDLYRLRGSKYLQSTIGETYKTAKQVLNQGRYVLFTGTPCQIDGLLHYLNKKYDKLYTQDIICHGVPSPMVWQKYLKYQGSVYGGEVDRKSLPAFRRKDEGWKRYSVSYRFADDTEYRQTLDKDLFMNAFLSNICLRPSCYNCHSKSLNRNSDITLADFWGIENELPEMFDDKGTSLVLVNSDKGLRLFNDISENMKYREIEVNRAVKYNPSVRSSVKKPANRKRFMRKVNDRNFKEMVEKYKRLSVWDRVILNLKILCKKTLDNITN